MRETATQAANRNIDRIEERLANIAQALETYKTQAEAGCNWTHVGDLANINETLGEITTFLGIEDERPAGFRD